MNADFPAPSPQPASAALGAPTKPAADDGPTRALVGKDVILDARLALFHRTERWLAVADVHFGYELSQRAAGGLFPLWGMDSIEQRLLSLLIDYQPERLIIVGDFVHDAASRPQALALLARLREGTGEHDGCAVTLVAGNHDRRAFLREEMCDFHATERFLFYHGDGPAPTAQLAGRTAVIGHHHPAVTLRDGAGLSIKLPALVQTPDRWILPAFSPWAAGGGGGFGRDAKKWLCSPNASCRRAESLTPALPAVPLTGRRARRADLPAGPWSPRGPLPANPSPPPASPR